VHYEVADVSLAVAMPSAMRSSSSRAGSLCLVVCISSILTGCHSQRKERVAWLVPDGELRRVAPANNPCATVLQHKHVCRGVVAFLRHQRPKKEISASFAVHRAMVQLFRLGKHSCTQPDAAL
jgi:hypothetical protein